MRQIAISFIIFIITCIFPLTPSSAAGPWKGQIIDIETKEPLEGAVVVAIWDRVWRTPTGSVSDEYEVKEALTDKEGRFKIPSYTPINLLPLISYIDEPEFIIFKPGYGSLRMAMEEYLTGKAMKIKEMELSGEKYRLSPGIVELPKLKTREERLRAIPSHLEEEYKTPIVNKLIDEEDHNLGLK